MRSSVRWSTIIIVCIFTSWFLLPARPAMAAPEDDKIIISPYQFKLLESPYGLKGANLRLMSLAYPGTVDTQDSGTTPNKSPYILVGDRPTSIKDGTLVIVKPKSSVIPVQMIAVDTRLDPNQFNYVENSLRAWGENHVTSWSQAIGSGVLAAFKSVAVGAVITSLLNSLSIIEEIPTTIDTSALRPNQSYSFTIVGRYMEITYEVELIPGIKPLPLYGWYDAKRVNYLTTTDTEWDPKKTTKRGDYTSARTEGYLPQSQQSGSLPLYGWYNAERKDYQLTTDPTWGPDRRSNTGGYTFKRTEGYLPQSQQPGSLPLFRWYSKERRYTVLTTHPDWDPKNKYDRKGYTFVRIEGYLPQSQ